MVLTLFLLFSYSKQWNALPDSFSYLFFFANFKTKIQGVTVM